MKKRLEKILNELIADYEIARDGFQELDPASRDLAVQALANNLVLIQTQLNNCNLWQQHLGLQEELKRSKLVNKDIIEFGIDRINTPPVEVD